MNAVTAPILARPNQQKKKSGRFSMAMAQTSPGWMPRARKVLAYWLARSSTSR